MEADTDLRLSRSQTYRHQARAVLRYRPSRPSLYWDARCLLRI